MSAVLLIGSPAAPARADGEGPERPWGRGVPEERRQKAEQLFQEGRALHRSLLLGEARAKYEEALAHWEQPELRLYLGRVLMRIGLPLLAYENLQKALQWGPGALDPEVEQEARAAMRELLHKELAVVEMRCDEPGAAIVLDGKPWFVGPGAQRRLVVPGEHIVTAKKTGYYLVVKPVVVLAGKQASGAIQLSADKTITERRWSAWVPWAAVGAGAAAGLLGAGLSWQAGTHHDEAEQKMRGACSRTCPPSSGGEYDQGLLENRVAIGSFIAGGAALITGAVLVYVNTPRSYRTEDRGDVKIELAPVVSDSVAGLTARVSF